MHPVWLLAPGIELLLPHACVSSAAAYGTESMHRKEEMECIKEEQFALHMVEEVLQSQ